MKIGGLIVGPVSRIVRDGRTLRGMAHAGYIKWPVDGTGNPYVDEGDNPRHFEYKGKRYFVRYFDGCFYPFVVLEEDK